MVFWVRAPGQARRRYAEGYRHPRRVGRTPFTMDHIRPKELTRRVNHLEPGTRSPLT